MGAARPFLFSFLNTTSGRSPYKFHIQPYPNLQ
jgi:hypothetical protein